MREWWANVYVKNGRCAVGVRNDERDGLEASRLFAAYAVHVRLKPEGAPKRYASEANRRAWEENPNAMRLVSLCAY